MISYAKAKIDKMQLNCKCMLCREKDEIINYRVSKLAEKEYKTKSNLVGKVIHWKMSKKSKFDHATKSYTYKPEIVLENEMCKIL